jgi:hypothetical protein
MRKILLRILYWLAVLVISLAILVGLILLLESRDDSSVGASAEPAGVALSAAPRS